MTDEPISGAASTTCPSRAVATAAELAIAAGICTTVDKVFHNPYCGVLFRCHCTWPWAGGSDPCNIHHARGPRCPWCNVRNTPLRWLAWAITDATTISCMLAAYCLVWVLQHRRLVSAPLDTVLLLAPTRKRAVSLAARRLGLRLLAAIVTFLVLGLALGLTFFLGTDYPCFLWIAPEGPNGTRCGFVAGS